jgi:hypothetical protein
MDEKETALIRNLSLYAVTVLIWGSTWLGIKFQLGEVDPLVSVVYRFSLASILLALWCGIRGLPMRFARRDHLFIALQGACLFAVNYWLFYLAEVHLTSGIVAVMFSTIVFWNILNGRIFLKTPVRANVICGACLGITGIGLVFWPELSSFSLADDGFKGFVLSMAATLMASFGNILSARNQRHGPAGGSNQCLWHGLRNAAHAGGSPDRGKTLHRRSVRPLYHFPALPGPVRLRDRLWLLPDPGGQDRRRPGLLCHPAVSHYRPDHLHPLRRIPVVAACGSGRGRHSCRQCPFPCKNDRPAIRSPLAVKSG